LLKEAAPVIHSDKSDSMRTAAMKLVFPLLFPPVNSVIGRISTSCVCSKTRNPESPTLNILWLVASPACVLVEFSINHCNGQPRGYLKLSPASWGLTERSKELQSVV